MVDRPISEALVTLVKEYEGFGAVAYLCPSNKWTIGYGTTVWPTGRAVVKGDRISPQYADQILRRQLAYFQKEVLSLLKVPVTDNQLAALTSFAYNVGLDKDTDTIPEGLGDSTLLKKLNAKDYTGAANEFPKWVYGGNPKRILPGLVRRRNEEKALFLKK